MSDKNKIPEVDIVVDEAAGVIREVKPEKLRSKKGHERRVNTSIYIILILMSVIWLAPFVFLVPTRQNPAPWSTICFRSNGPWITISGF